jgi:hypothetical protein
MHVVAARVAPSHHTLHSSAVRRSLLLRRKTLRFRHPSTARCALARARHLARKAESRATRGCRSHLFLHPIASRCDSGITHTMQRAQPRAMTRQRFARESATPACVWMREGRERRKGREGKGRRAERVTISRQSATSSWKTCTLNFSEYAMIHWYLCTLLQFYNAR